MKEVTRGFAVWLSVVASLNAQSNTKPNIICILADDQGYADIGAMGIVDDVKTPNLDALVADGVRCTAGYITAPQCAPSRAGLMTGRYQQRFCFDTIPDGPLPLREITIAERLKEAGYITGHVGKWHLEPNHTCVKWAQEECPESIRNGRVHLTWEQVAEYQSGAQGFDDFYSGEQNHYWCNYDREKNRLKRSGEHRNFPPSEYRLDIQTDAALAFIDRHHEQPFFLYLCYYAPHVPLDATKKYLSRFPDDMPERRRTALSMISAMDDGVGKIREKLANYGVDENTIIFYISDNGAPLGAQQNMYMKDVLPVEKSGIAWDGSCNDPLTGEKGMLMEGGIRVPYLVSWPAQLPKGLVYDKPVSSLDVAATCVAAAGLKKPRELDGLDLVPFLSGKCKNERSLFWRFWNQAAVRSGEWKYFIMGDGTQYLVNLANDPQERRNLLMEYPEKVQQMKLELARWADELQPKGLPSEAPNGQEKAWYRYYLKSERPVAVELATKSSKVELPSMSARKPLQAKYAIMDADGDKLLSKKEFINGRARSEKVALMKKENLSEEQYLLKLNAYRDAYKKNFLKRDADQNGFLSTDELLEK